MAGPLSLVAILRFERFLAATDAALEGVTSSRLALLAFAAALLVVPPGLILIR